MSTSLEQDIYDVIVVGASFAGLSFVSVASALGLQVVEKDGKVGVCTTWVCSSAMYWTSWMCRRATC